MPTAPLPRRRANQTWRKVSLWQTHLEGISGSVLFVDLDVVITGSIDEFFDFKPEATFCVAENWSQMGSKIGNTSVYRFQVGAHAYIYEALRADPEGITSRFPNSQTFISRTAKNMEFWPAGWCVSFKHTLMPTWPLNFVMAAKLPPSTKIVCFTGKPDPDEARDGRWPAPWYKKLYKHIRPTPWIAEHWHED